MEAEYFIRALKKQGIDAFYGVPDSLLKSLCAYISDHTDSRHNIITANEGNAIGLACGHYLATGRPAAVYMQNSGQGNVVNPLLSLMDEDVYSIPVLLLIGWRGEPGISDEPQHTKQGKVTLELLNTMGISYTVLDKTEAIANQQITEACTHMALQKRPYALVVRKNIFEPYTLQHKRASLVEMSREEAICTIASLLAKDDIIISSTGQISRELYEFRTRVQSSHQSDFLTVGAMGHASSIAMGVALNKPERRVICMDGDGAFLMHMGAAAIIGNAGLKNLRHIIINNAAHDSVGGQPTVGNQICFEKISAACGYSHFYKASTVKEILAIMPIFLSTPGTSMFEIQVSCGSRADLGRPKETPKQNKEMFMNFLEEAKTIMYPGCSRELKNLIREKHWNQLLIFTTEGRKKSLEELFASITDTAICKFYTDITPNPSAEGVSKALSSITSHPDAIIAIGGGSVIDFAKLFRACIDNHTDVESYFNDKIKLVRKTPLIAVPTTAGTGSEATRFAVVYIRGEKYSLDSAAVMPDYAFVDSTLMANAPSYLKASCGLDTLAQAIEGYWAKAATEESDNYAIQALELCRENLENFVKTELDIYAQNMAMAANLAGKCINLTRTTAAHALSYKITQLYGIPHGHAVALSLPGLMSLHEHKAPANSQLMNKMKKVHSTLCPEFSHIKDYLLELYDRIGILYDLEKLNIHSTDSIVDGVNTERLSNHPIPLTKCDMKCIFGNENLTISV